MFQPKVSQKFFSRCKISIQFSYVRINTTNSIRLFQEKCSLHLKNSTLHINTLLKHTSRIISSLNAQKFTVFSYINIFILAIVSSSKVTKMTRLKIFLSGTSNFRNIQSVYSPLFRKIRNIITQGINTAGFE